MPIHGRTRTVRKLGLGLDIGGAFIDSVLMNIESRDVLAKAKCPTMFKGTKDNLNDVLDLLLRGKDDVIDDISIIGVSTTLATNSILERRGGRVGLIGIGWEKQRGWELGAYREAYLGGGHDTNGHEVEPLDRDSLVHHVKNMDDVDTYVISSKFSIYNPCHEEEARDLVREISGRPVVLGHELTDELGVLERTVTAVLNAKLLPVIDSYLSNLSDSLRSMGVNSEIMILKGDGHLMNLSSARKRPVETILSGPAASVIGAKALSGLDDCLIMDIGGTSTDITFLKDGRPNLNKYGAAIGSWRTRVRAIDMWTTGLGGDSRINVDFFGNVMIGPERSVPLAIAGQHFPSLKERIERMGTTEFLLLNAVECEYLDKNDRRVIKFVRENGPVTMEELEKGLRDIPIIKEISDSLCKRGCLIMTGLTPTDVLHRGPNAWGDLEASTAGVLVTATHSRMEVNDFVDRFMKKITTRLAEEVLMKVYLEDTGEEFKSKCEQLLSLVLGETKLEHADVLFQLHLPIVGLGAIANILIPLLEERLGTNVIIPEHHEVGNAIGSILSDILETVKVYILAKREGDFEVISSSTRHFKSDISEAISMAKELATELARNKAIEAGGVNIEVTIDVKERVFQDGLDGKMTNWIEVTASASGDPKAVG